MTRRLRPIAAIGVCTAILAGCSVDAFTYTIGRYGTATGIHVRLGCNDTYEVFDRPDAGVFLVATNVVNEGLAGLCADGRPILPKPERMRRIAEIFLAETTDRPQCGLVREAELTPKHTEFGYRCPAPPTARPKGRR